MANETTNKFSTFESMSGANTTVLFEFPDYDKEQGSIYILMRSVVSLSVSVHRAKIPVITLGENAVQGFALGNKTVAGSIIKTLTFNDELDGAIKYFTDKSLKEKQETFKKNLGSRTLTLDEKYQISQKQFDTIMRDDLIPFNIHSYAFSEYTGQSKMLLNSVYGCTIINEGQVQSIENLITENTFSFIAKYAILGRTVTGVELPTFPSTNTVMTGTQLLANKKR